ncbi:hypothetical protein B0H15DRAFT_465507, partial [Mycena belliarum]
CFLLLAFPAPQTRSCRRFRRSRRQLYFPAARAQRGPNRLAHHPISQSQSVSSVPAPVIKRKTPLHIELYAPRARAPSQPQHVPRHPRAIRARCPLHPREHRASGAAHPRLDSTRPPQLRSARPRLARLLHCARRSNPLPNPRGQRRRRIRRHRAWAVRRRRARHRARKAEGEEDEGTPLADGAPAPPRSTSERKAPSGRLIAAVNAIHDPRAADAFPPSASGSRMRSQIRIRRASPHPRFASYRTSRRGPENTPTSNNADGVEPGARN